MTRATAPLVRAPASGPRRAGVRDGPQPDTSPAAHGPARWPATHRRPPPGRSRLVALRPGWDEAGRRVKAFCAWSTRSAAATRSDARCAGITRADPQPRWHGTPPDLDQRRRRRRRWPVAPPATRTWPPVGSRCRMRWRRPCAPVTIGTAGSAARPAGRGPPATWALEEGPALAAPSPPSADHEQVSQLRICDELSIPVTAAAGRSGACGSSVPPYGGAVLDLCDLTGIRRSTVLTADVLAARRRPLRASCASRAHVRALAAVRDAVDRRRLAPCRGVASLDPLRQDRTWSSALTSSRATALLSTEGNACQAWPRLNQVRRQRGHAPSSPRPGCAASAPGTSGGWLQLPRSSTAWACRHPPPRRHRRCCGSTTRSRPWLPDWRRRPPCSTRAIGAGRLTIGSSRRRAGGPPPAPSWSSSGCRIATTWPSSSR